MRMGMRVSITFNDENNTEFEYDSSNGLRNVDITTTSASSPEQVSYGIISNYGKVEFVDTNNSVYSFIASETFSTYTVCIFNDNEIVGKFYGSRAIKYDVYTNICTIEFNGIIEKLQLAMYSLPFKYANENKTAYFIYENLVSQSKSFVFEIDDKTKTHLESISIRYPYLEESTLWEQWNKLAQLGQLRIYMQENGTVRVVKYG